MGLLLSSVGGMSTLDNKGRLQNDEWRLGDAEEIVALPDEGKRQAHSTGNTSCDDIFVLK